MSAHRDRLFRALVWLLAVVVVVGSYTSTAVPSRVEPAGTLAHLDCVSHDGATHGASALSGEDDDERSDEDEAGSRAP